MESYMIIFYLILSLSVWKNIGALKRLLISWNGYFYQIIWFNFHRVHFKTSLQYDLQSSRQNKVFKIKENLLYLE